MAAQHPELCIPSEASHEQLASMLLDSPAWSASQVMLAHVPKDTYCLLVRGSCIV